MDNLRNWRHVTLWLNGDQPIVIKYLARVIDAYHLALSHLTLLKRITAYTELTDKTCTY